VDDHDLERIRVGVGILRLGHSEAPLNSALADEFSVGDVLLLPLDGGCEKRASMVNCAVGRKITSTVSYYFLLFRLSANQTMHCHLRTDLWLWYNRTIAGYFTQVVPHLPTPCLSKLSP